MYKIIELNEREITNFKGKIIQVIKSDKRNVRIYSGCFGGGYTSYMWVLTCLVEVE